MLRFLCLTYFLVKQNNCDCSFEWAWTSHIWRGDEKFDFQEKYMFFVSCIGSNNDLHLNISIVPNCFPSFFLVYIFDNSSIHIFDNNSSCSFTFIFFDYSCIRIFDNNSSVQWLCTGRQNWQVGETCESASGQWRWRWQWQWQWQFSNDFRPVS